MDTVASRGWKTKHLGGARGTKSSCNGEEAGLACGRCSDLTWRISSVTNSPDVYGSQRTPTNLQ